MTYNRCKISGEDAKFLREQFRDQALERDGIFAYVTSVGSASNLEDYSAAEVGNDYDFLAVPAKGVQMGEFLSEIYDMTREVNEAIREYHSEDKVPAPFPESHVQNLALREAAQEEAKRELGAEKSVEELRDKTNQMYENIIGQHIILVESWEGIISNLPEDFPIESGDTLVGSPDQIPETKYEDSSLVKPYFEGVHKHAGAILAPNSYSEDAVTGAAVHAVDQAEKDTGIQLVDPENKENTEITSEEALNMVDDALEELDTVTESKSNSTA